MPDLDPLRTTDRPNSVADDSVPTTDRSRLDTSGDIAAAPAPALPTPYPVIPGYEIVSELGRGGMGVVYYARHTTLNRPVAIKMILGGRYTDPVAQARFLVEAEVIASLTHTHVVQLFEFGRCDDQPYFVLEYVAGGTLARKLREAGRFAPHDAAVLVAKLADAMAAAHAQGVVHRDLKPANVLLTAEGEPKVTDFGLAKVGDSGATATGAVMGTPSYMAPEQAAGRTKDVGTSADVYALGAILYQILTGRAPFRGDTVMDTIQKVLTAAPERPRTLVPGVPRDLETVCLKCLEKRAADRYATAAALADDLRRFASGEPVSVRPAGAAERLVKWARRKPTLAGLYAAVLVGSATIAAATAFALLWRDTERLRAAADSARSTAVTARDEAVTLNAKLDAALVAVNRSKAELARHRYAADLIIAGRAWHEGDIGRMMSILNRYRLPPEDDSRGFEWYYLRGQERCELWRGNVAYAQLSPDGKYLATATEEGVELLDPHTRAVVRKLPGFAIVGCGFAFSGDSRRLIVPVGGSESLVWDVERGTEVARMKANDAALAGVFINAAGTLAATRGQGSDRTVRLWDANTGTLRHRWNLKTYAMLAAFSPDGKHLALLTGGAIQVYSLSDYTLAHTIALGGLRVNSLTYHPAGTWLIAAASDDTMTFWNAATGLPESPPIKLGGLAGAELDITPDGKYYLTGSNKDGTVRLWDGATGRLLSTRKGHDQKPSRVSLHPDGVLALSQDLGNGVRLWDMRGPQEFEEVTGPFKAPRGIAFNPDPRLQELAFFDGRGKFYFSTGADLRHLVGQEAPIAQFAFSPDGKRLLTADARGNGIFWDVATGARLHALDEPVGSVIEVAYGHSGTLVATVNRDKTIRIWDAHTGRQRHQFPAPTTNNGVVKLDFRPSTDVLVVAQAFEGLQFIHPGDPPRVESVRDKVMTYHLAFSPDGARIATVSGPFAVTVWGFPKLDAELQLQGHTESVMAFRFSPDSQRLATGSVDGTIKLWEMTTGQELLSLPSGRVWELAFSPDGRRLAAVGGGDAIRIWNTARGHEDRASYSTAPLLRPVP